MLLAGMVLASIASLCWAGNWVMGRAIRADVPPFGLVFWRWLTAAVILLPFVARDLAQTWPVIRANWPIMLGLGVTGGASFQAMIYIGLRSTEALNALLVSSMGPLFVLFCAWVALGHRIGARQMIGIALSLCGVAYLVARGDVANLAQLSFNRGDLWIFAAMFVWGVYSILLKNRPAELKPLSLVFVTSVLAAIMIAPFYVWETATGQPMRFDMPAVVSVGYTAIFASIIALLSYEAATRFIGPG
ncbi:MAG: DMT family transporter, partial [Pseudomonadota bacterium]